MTLINWEIIKNPLSWVIIFLMITLASIGASYVFSAKDSA